MRWLDTHHEVTLRRRLCVRANCDLLQQDELLI